MSARGYALHSVRPHLSSFFFRQKFFSTKVGDSDRVTDRNVRQPRQRAQQQQCPRLATKSMLAPSWLLSPLALMIIMN